MTLGKAALVTYAVVLTLVVGYQFMPDTMKRDAADVAVEPAIVDPAPEVNPAVAASPRADARVAPRWANAVATVSTSSPELHEQLKPVLSRGTDVSIASADFTNATEFAAVAHAARNTGIPFMLLKHRVVNEDMSLERAIRASALDVNAEIEAELAVAQARSDLSDVAPMRSGQ